MKAAWKTRRFGDVCRFVRGPFGGSLKKNVFVADGYAVYEQSHAIYDQFEEIRYFIDDQKFREMQRFEIRPNDLIMSCSGTMGKVAIAPENIRRGIINQALLKLTPSSVISSFFLKYWMDSSGFQESLNAGGAAIQNVASVGILKEIQVPLPALPEQQRIIHILDEAFDGIATANANAEKNLQNARFLFESHLQRVFNQRGEGWLEKPLGAVCKFIGGSQPPKSVFSKTGGADNIRLIQIRDYKGDKHLVFIPLSRARRFCKADDVMIGRYGPPVFQILRGLEGAYNVALMKAVPDEKMISRDYLFYFLKNGKIQRYIIGLSNRAAGQSGLNKETIEPYPIMFPSLSSQSQIVQTIKELEGAVESLESIYRQKLAALDALKKSLLHRAFTGDL